MVAALPLKAALKRGALVALANWPVIVVEFTIESLYKLALVVPVVGGALMVTVLAGGSLRAIFADDVRSAAAVVVSALSGAPLALSSFLLAATIVAVGGAMIMFQVKAGTLAVLIDGERQAADFQSGPLTYETFQLAHAYATGALLEGMRRFGRRAMILSVYLSVAYAVIAFGYFAILVTAFKLTQRPGFGSAWPLIVAIGTVGAIILVIVVNLVFDLVRIIMTCDDCALGPAASRLWAFLIVDSRQVVGIFAVVGVLVVLAAAASLLVAAGLALVAWVPVVGLIVFPLQAAAWLIRGLLFQYMALSAIAAYESQYRRFAAP